MPTEIEDLLSPEQLDAYVREDVTRAPGIYAGKTDDEIESLLTDLVAALQARPELSIEAEFSSYGSGWASFVDVFCARSAGRSTVAASNGESITTGIRLYVSRLTPLAVYGMGEVRRDPRGRAWNFLEPQGIGTVADSWNLELDLILTVLQQFELLVLPRKLAERHLPFDADLDTNLGQAPFTVFDAIFHWYD